MCIKLIFSSLTPFYVNLLLLLKKIITDLVIQNEINLLFYSFVVQK